MAQETDIGNYSLHSWMWAYCREVDGPEEPRFGRGMQWVSEDGDGDVVVVVMRITPFCEVLLLGEAGRHDRPPLHVRKLRTHTRKFFNIFFAASCSNHRSNFGIHRTCNCYHPTILKIEHCSTQYSTSLSNATISLLLTTSLTPASHQLDHFTTFTTLLDQLLT